MSHFEFAIPLQRDELLNPASGEYKVEEIVPVESIPVSIKNCIFAFKDEGCVSILDNFDSLYSVLIHFNALEWSLITKIFDELVLGSLNQLCYFVEPLVEDVPDSETQTRALNILKMNLYIFSQIVGCIHDRKTMEANASVSEKGKGRKGKKNKLDELGWDWDEKARLSFIALYQLLQLPIAKLWDPPVPEEQFINMCANSCYKVLECPSIAHVKSKPLRESLFQVLGVLIKRFSHGISCVVKIVQLLTLFEHVVSPLAWGVVMFVRDLGFKSLVNEIVRELMATTENTQDNSSVRSFSNFLVEIAELEPEIMIPTTKELTKYLEQDPYSMRCCVLTVMTEILLNQLTQEDLDNKAKEQRDLYLELLEEHTCDGNAFVRSRVLQLFCKIVQHNGIPKSKFLGIVDIGLERVMDKSSNVCKHAIILLKVMLEQNPYGVKLDMQQLINQLLSAEEKLQILERKVGSFKNMTREKIWDTLEPEVVLFLSTNINFAGTEEMECSQLTQMLSKATLDENVKTIAVLITNRKFEQAYDLIRAIERILPGAKDLKSDMPANNTLNYYLTLMKETFLMYADESQTEKTDSELVADVESDEAKAALSKAQEELLVQKALVIYLMDCLEFAKKVEEAISSVILVLNEESITEVLEAIHFLTVAFQFGIPSADRGVQEMLRLVFRKEPTIKEAVNTAYNNMYLLVSEKCTKREKAIEEVNRLSKLASTLDHGQIEALSSLIVGWIKTKELDEEFISVLWDRVKSPNIDRFKKQTSLLLLSMAALENPKMAKDQLSVIISNGLQYDCSEANNSFTVLFSCQIISRITMCKSPTGEYVRYPPDFHMFPLLIQAIKTSFIALEGNEIFIRLAREVINNITELSTEPNVMCGVLLCDLFDMMVSQSSSDSDETKDETINDDVRKLEESQTSTSTTPDKNELDKTKNSDGCDVKSNNETLVSLDEEGDIMILRKEQVKTDTLLRFLFLIGHIAFKYSQFLENYYLEILKLKTREQFKLLSPSKNASRILESSRRSNKPKQQKSEEEVLTETDLMAAADDIASEEVRQMLDSKIVSGNGVIAGFSLLILNVCRNPKKYKDPLLKCIAATALTQTMMVSSTFCHKHMQLVVTLLEKSPEESVRLSLVIAFGDLLFKFPNVVEPWTRFLYARLRDESCKVRRNTLLVLSHLVTNEMVKVKGQISEVALCIVDKNEEIVDLAKRFFAELSHKGNTLYNVLPDIISHLSNPESDITVEEKDFETILKYIMEQIQKEKQLENLVEKLCKRIKESLCERQWKDLAFCLFLLPWSDRSLRRLIDYAGCYCDRLLHEPVAELFLSIVNTVTKSTKPGLKEIGAELQALINEVLTKGSADHIQDPDESVADRLTKTPGKNTRKTPGKTPGTRKTGKKSKKVKYMSDSEDEYNDSDEDGEEKEVFKKNNKTRSGRTNVKLF